MEVSIACDHIKDFPRISRIKHELHEFFNYFIFGTKYVAIKSMRKIIFQDESYNIIRACISVHKELGCGFLEAVYQEALAIEFRNCGIPFHREATMDIYFQNVKLKKSYIADFICYDKIILELKAISTITTEHEAQVLNYLKASGLKLGMLINFGQISLKYKRLVL